MDNKFLYIIKECKKCEGKGWRFKHWIEKGELRSNATKCECHERAVQHERLANANVPMEYYDLNYKEDFVDNSGTIKPKIMKVIDNIEEFYRKGQCLYLHGQNGNGKTFSAVEILRKASMQGYSIYYDWFPTMVDLYNKKGYKAYDEQREYDDIIKKTDFFVIDELGKESENGSYNKSDVNRLLEINILKKRSSKNTIIISNLLDENTLKTTYSPSIFSVMSHKFYPIHFKGTDFRNAIGREVRNEFFQEEINGNDTRTEK